jgi:hypothetical protein
MKADRHSEAEGLERRMNRLADERSALFTKAGTRAGLSKDEHERVKTIGRELDECFVLRRVQRAARDAHRFSREFTWQKRVPRDP